MSGFLLCLGLISGSAPRPAPDVEPAPPNILLIIVDDLGTEMLASYGIGKDVPNTPVIDKLATRSVLFRNAWATPLCSPTRACIQTGRFGFRTGIGTTVKDTVAYNGLSASEIILPEMLDAGTNRRFQHALFGKWHLNHASMPDASGAPVGPDVVRVQGYGHHEGIIHNIVAPDGYFSWPKVSNGVETQSTKYATTATVDDFLGWQATAHEPFFAVVAFNAPHTPLHAPPAKLHSVDLKLVGPVTINPRPYYKAMVEALDTELGRLLSRISTTTPNTTIILMGDNGTPEKVTSADPFSILPPGHSKGSAYEGGVNVPLLVSGPRVLTPGSECLAMVHAVDIFATVAELAEVDLRDPAVYPAERALDSKSLVPYLTDPALDSQRRYLFTEKFFENTPEGAQVDTSQLHRTDFCQEPLPGTGSGGGLELSVCGRALVEMTDNEATITLRGAPPNATAYLLAGKLNPISNPLYDGQVTLSSKVFKQVFLTSGKLDPSLPLTTSALGELVVPGLIHQTGNPSDFFLQVAVLDPATGAWSISSGVRVNQTINLKAVANAAGYKLISNVSAGLTELYYLPTDPRETVDLAALGLPGLNESERGAYLELREALAAILDSASE